MKFDFIIGNPPYQDETLGENKGFAPPIYNLFLDNAYEVADKVEMIHPARFLFNAGSTPKAWNKKMLNDSHFTVLRYESNASSVFPGTDIKGGVAISYYDKTKEFTPIGIFTPYEELNSILTKVLKNHLKGLLMRLVFLGMCIILRNQCTERIRMLDCFKVKGTSMI